MNARNMPKKRKCKTSTSTHLRPLKFVNSPVYQAAPVLTPALAVDNPIRAKTVPVVELSENSWISPQFRNDFCPGRRCQSTQHYHKSCQPRHQFGNLPSESGQSIRKCKFKPLHFITNSDSAVPKQRSDLSELLCQYHTNGNTSDKCRDECEHLWDDGPAMPGISNVLSQSLNPDVINLNCENDHQPIVMSDSEQSGERVNHHAVNRISHRAGLPRPQNSFTVDRSDCDKTVLVNTSPRFRNEDTKMTTLEHLPRKSTDSHSGKGTRSPQKNIFWDYFAVGTPPKLSTGPAVLAMDTPECDYGLTVRQRQLKYGYREARENVFEQLTSS